MTNPTLCGGLRWPSFARQTPPEEAQGSHGVCQFVFEGVKPPEAARQPPVEQDAGQCPNGLQPEEPGVRDSQHCSLPGADGTGQQKHQNETNYDAQDRVLMADAATRRFSTMSRRPFR